MQIRHHFVPLCYRMFEVSRGINSIDAPSLKGAFLMARRIVFQYEVPVLFF